MAHKTLIGGTAYEITGGKTLIGGTGYSIKGGKTLIGGTGYDISFVSGTPLNEIAEGSVVYLNENGSPVEFYVAKHNYESGLNGSGRTLLVRKDCYSNSMQWHSSNKNIYASSTINSWLVNTYKSLLDAKVQTAIGTTRFYYTPGNGDKTVTTLSRSVFLLSMTEIKQATQANTEGTELPISSTLKIAKFNGSACGQWTRSPYKNATDKVCRINASGNTGTDYCLFEHGVRPAMTIPEASLFDPDTMQFIA